MAKRRRVKKPPEGVFEATIEKLSHEGRGIAYIEGKTTFIDLALPDEKVQFKYTATHSKYDEAIAIKIENPNENHIEAKCAVFGICGGCSLQHLSENYQTKLKEDTLKNHFEHFGNLKPEHWLKPLINENPWHYRTKGRLGVRYVHKKEKVLVGFRERDGRFLTDMDSCPILEQSVSQMLPNLKELILSLSIYREIAQIELAVDDQKTALIMRHLNEFSEGDLEKLRVFAKENKIWLYLQPKGPNTICLFYPEIEKDNQYLSYLLSDYDVEIRFQPNDFTQVNTHINKLMLAQAIKYLDIQKEDKILDLFCGLGNFSLPIARFAKEVIGVEGDKMMTKRALENAQLNKINNAAFYPANLFESVDGFEWANQAYDKILLDPPRAGALEIVNQIEKFNAQKIVYVSCNPATLARDAGILVNEKGYRMTSAGIMDMFPHTTHVESMAVFEK